MSQDSHSESKPGHAGDSAAHVLPIAAIVHADHADTDRLLAKFVDGLRHAGLRIHGLVQERAANADKTSTMLVDQHSGQRYPLFQNLGSGSTSCCVDAGSIAAASVAMRRAVEARPDLCVANRFGGLEAQGGGLAAEMLNVAAAGIPLLTIVSNDYLRAWRAFTGDSGTELQPSIEAMYLWFAGLRARHARS